ncbi:universal stress protein [Phormidium sp. LEGE 05292]|uniref:universal stress protein n=1 Tax=[Phormidium] sp. LEGE 05292 TaxID=767427 RepID=UPI001882CCA5|nr:universal stress protein [Phormidium sp. LEGE 05292]MBE9228164.1 universal stress protein [Phormidium sp. LEGE 05292]
MYKKILVAMDNSEISQQVFNSAVSMGKQNNATLMLLHVLTDEEMGLTEIASQHISALEYHAAMVEQVEAYLKEKELFRKKYLSLLEYWVQEAADAGVPAEYTLNYGGPGRTICDLANNWDADLIMMGRRGLSGFSEFFMGSISNYVVHHSPCSVFIVQDKRQKGKMTEVIKAETEG